MWDFWKLGCKKLFFSMPTVWYVTSWMITFKYFYNRIYKCLFYFLQKRHKIKKYKVMAYKRTLVVLLNLPYNNWSVLYFLVLSRTTTTGVNVSLGSRKSFLPTSWTCVVKTLEEFSRRLGCDQPKWNLRWITFASQIK